MKTTMNLTEQTAFHLPALHLLCKIGYQYLTPQEALTLRNGRLGEATTPLPDRCAATLPLGRGRVRDGV